MTGTLAGTFTVDVPGDTLAIQNTGTIQSVNGGPSEWIVRDGDGSDTFQISPADSCLVSYAWIWNQTGQEIYILFNGSPIASVAADAPPFFYACPRPWCVEYPVCSVSVETNDTQDGDGRVLYACGGY